MRKEEIRIFCYNLFVIFVLLLGFHYVEVSFGFLAGIIYLVFGVIMLFIFLRRNLCTNCVYYGRYCYTGWGLLASKLFSKSTGNFKLGSKLAGLTWIVVLIVPLVVILLNYSRLGLYTLLLWISLSIFLMVDHFSHCKTCEMRNRCYGKKVVKYSH